MNQGLHLCGAKTSARARVCRFVPCTCFSCAATPPRLRSGPAPSTSPASDTMSARSTSRHCTHFAAATRLCGGWCSDFWSETPSAAQGLLLGPNSLCPPSDLGSAEKVVLAKPLGPHPQLAVAKPLGPHPQLAVEPVSTRGSQPLRKALWLACCC